MTAPAIEIKDVQKSFGNISIIRDLNDRGVPTTRGRQWGYTSLRSLLLRDRNCGRLVHRKKDATDWGVEPNIVVAMDDATQEKVLRERTEAELFKKPLPKATTWLTVGSAIAPVLMPSTSSSERSPSLMRAASAFV